MQSKNQTCLLSVYTETKIYEKNWFQGGQKNNIISERVISDGQLPHVKLPVNYQISQSFRKRNIGGGF